MAARFSFTRLGARWWQSGPCGPCLLLATGAGAAIEGRQNLFPRWSLCEDNARERSAADLRTNHLAYWQSTEAPLLAFEMVKERQVNKRFNPMALEYPDFGFMDPGELVAGHIIINDSKSASRETAIKDGCVRANACKDIWWDPPEVKAAVVTCGGLCPGLNSIIRGVTNTLHGQYGVKQIIGIQSGYNGLKHPEKYPPIDLTPENTREIHLKGGSILKAGRGGLDDVDLCLDNLEKLGINHLYVVGGDGTQAGANLLYKAARKRGLNISIVGIPKSIDNDIVIIDKTFGFDSAVAQASEILANGWIEATSCTKAVSIVKLMGRNAGFVAMNASRASTLVDCCLIPEVKWKVGDVLDYVDSTLAQKDFMLIAVAEGSGQEYVKLDKKDATGHDVFGDIGVYLKDIINAHLKEKGGRSFYIDPSYIIRSCPVRPNDHIFCSRLARDAVHTAMRGYTGVCVGPLWNIIVILPTDVICGKKKTVKLDGSDWQSCIQACKQPKVLTC